MGDLKEELMQKQNEFDLLKQQINTDNIKTDKEYNQKLNVLKDRLMDKERERNELNNKYNKIESENESLKKQRDEFQDKINKIKEENRMNSESSKLRIKTLQDNLKKLQSSKKIQFDILSETQQS